MKLVKSNLFVSTSENEGRERLEERRSEVQRNIRCVRRAVRLMVFLSGLAVVGLGYSTVLIPDWPQTLRQFFMFWPVKAHCALGFASSTCALLFFSLGLVYRRELSWLGTECRRLAEEVRTPEQARIIPLISGTNNHGPGDDWKEAA